MIIDPIYCFIPPRFWFWWIRGCLCCLFLLLFQLRFLCHIGVIVSFPVLSFGGVRINFFLYLLIFALCTSFLTCCCRVCQIFCMSRWFYAISHSFFKFHSCDLEIIVNAEALLQLLLPCFFPGFFLGALCLHLLDLTFFHFLATFFFSFFLFLLPR